MCAGDTALYELDTVEVTLTRQQAKTLRTMMEFEVKRYNGFPESPLPMIVARRVLEQLPKESA